MNIAAVTARPVHAADTSSSKKKHNDDKDHTGDRDSMLEAALGRRLDEFDDLKKAFGDAIQGKRPFDPPTHHGASVLRAWLHSVDPHDYRLKLEILIDQAEAKLEKLEERL
ncbi:hypothetical protein BGZ58_001791 [Dissophora ornata]|nr:hypothetical protein BGZ58_001791 [Dissophora ornata]